MKYLEPTNICLGYFLSYSASEDLIEPLILSHSLLQQSSVPIDYYTTVLVWATAHSSGFSSLVFGSFKNLDSKFSIFESFNFSPLSQMRKRYLVGPNGCLNHFDIAISYFLENLTKLLGFLIFI